MAHNLHNQPQPSQNTVDHPANQPEIAILQAQIQLLTEQNQLLLRTLADRCNPPVNQNPTANQNPVINQNPAPANPNPLPVQNVYPPPPVSNQPPGAANTSHITPQHEEEEIESHFSGRRAPENKAKHPEYTEDPSLKSRL